MSGFQVPMQDANTHPLAWGWRWSLLVGFAVLYGVCLPSTVQTLDSGELVAAAWKLMVAHPPGYPLFIWLHHGFAKLVPLGSVFYRAALANALCVLGALALLLRLATSWVGVALIAVLGTTPVFWRYGVLPDVFGLHLLLTAVIVAAAFEEARGLRVWVTAIAFGLGAANHQSIIFLLPLVVLVAFEEPSRARAVAALATGAMITVALYGSILALDSSAMDSWGSVDTVGEVVEHFLRKSYGTFQLSGYKTEANFVHVLQGFVGAAGLFGVCALVVLVRGLPRAWRERKTATTWWILAGCCALYIAVFFPRMNSGGHILHDGVRERFFLLPLLLIACMAVRAKVTAGRLAWLSPALAGALGLAATVQAVTGDAFGYRDDTVVEDYARNLLNTAKSFGRPAFVLVESDTQLFSMQYVAAVQEGFDDIVAMGIGNIFMVDRLAKVQARWPRFVFDVRQIFEGDKREVFRSFIGPNIDNFAVLSTVPVTNPHWRTTFYPLGRRIEAGTGVAIADAPVILRAPVHKAADGGYVETKELFADYAVQDLARGKALLTMGETQRAKDAFLAGLERVPYCLPCLKNYCVLDEHRDERCGAPLESLQKNEYHYLE